MKIVVLIIIIVGVEILGLIVCLIIFVIDVIIICIEVIVIMIDKIMMLIGFKRVFFIGYL